MSQEFTTVQEEVLAPENRVKLFKGVVPSGSTIAQTVDAISKGTVQAASPEEQAQLQNIADFLNTTVPAGKQLVMVVQIGLQLVNSN